MHNKAIIEWQSANKSGLSSSPENLAHYKQKLEEAKIAQEKSGDSWGCNPHEAKLALARLIIGQDDQQQVAQSFLSNTPASVNISATSSLISPDCEKPQLKWEISIPKYKIKRSGHVELTAKDESVSIPEPVTSGLSDDETIVYVDMSKPETWEIKSPTYSLQQHSSNHTGTIKQSLAIPEAPHGDRGSDFAVNLDFELLCNNSLADRLITVINHDDKDQLRQEYVDMKKAEVPKREDLKPNIISRHFTSEKFNSSENVSGNKYENILCKILLQLENVRDRANGAKMIINSGFRNPYKQAKVSKAKESMHMYGLAADIARGDFNGDGKHDNKDWDIMAQAAKQAGACVEPIKRAPTWIHMDWRSDCPIGW